MTTKEALNKLADIAITAMVDMPPEVRDARIKAVEARAAELERQVSNAPPK